MAIAQGPFEIQGVNLAQIAERFGTPLYLYDAEKMIRQLEKFKRAFSGLDLHVKYAMKSCSNISIVRLMKMQGTGLDTVSIPEILMGLQAGYDPQEIVFTPNVVSFDEIRRAVEIGCAINIENMSNLEKFGARYGNSIPCCIRLNPNLIAEVENGAAYGLNRFNINKEHYGAVDPERVGLWHNQSKFGISVTHLDQVMDIVDRYKIRVNGLHIHSSHVILNSDVFLKGASIIFDIAAQFAHLEYLDFGGGISVPHHEDDAVIDLIELGEAFKSAFESFCLRYGRALAVWFEPGRYLVSEAGALLVRVDVLKSNGTIQFAGVNSGFNHLLRPMMYDAYHQIVNISNPEGELKKYTVVGNLCEVDDLGKDRFLPETREGDILLIKNTGAYGFSMSSQYNSRFRPAEVMLLNGRAELIRKRETQVDLMRNQILIDADAYHR